MVDSRKLTGYSWHSEFLKKDEFDDRRDRRRCVYFFKNGSKQGYCNRGHLKCIGSSHCSHYKEKVENIFADENVKNTSGSKIILPPKKKNVIDMKIGDKIFHEKFGVGTIIEIKDKNLAIQFENPEYGKKILRYGVASIEKI